MNFIHGLHAVDHFARVHLLNCAANRAHDGRRIARGAQHHGDGAGHHRHQLLGQLHERIEELRFDGRFLIRARAPTALHGPPRRRFRLAH